MVIREIIKLSDVAAYNHINAKKSIPLVSFARAEAFQLKNQAYKAIPKNPKLFYRKVVNDVIKMQNVHAPIISK